MKTVTLLVLCIASSLSIGCATTATANYSTEDGIVAQSVPTPRPTAVREGDTIVAVGCASNVSSPMFARRTSEMRANAAALQLVCQTGAASVSGSQLKDTFFADGGAFCTKVSVPVTGISCLPGGEETDREFANFETRMEEESIAFEKELHLKR